MSERRNALLMSERRNALLSRNSLSHGCCVEGSKHSVSEKRRKASWDRGNWRCTSRGPQVEIDYSKLKELCLRTIPNETQSASKSVFHKDDHSNFMAQYSSIFQRRRTRSHDSINRPRIHSCSGTVMEPCGDISARMIAIHGRDKTEQKAIDLSTRLRVILLIARKLPMQRTECEVKQLAQHLLQFADLFPNSKCPLLSVVTGLATRVYIEELLKQGYSLPDHNGVYLILRGTVEKLSMNSETKLITSDILKPGDSFGSLEGTRDSLFKSTYPMFMSNESASLLRITQVDYDRVIQVYLNISSHEKETLVRSCSLMYGVHPSILTRLASDITWETVTDNKTILKEGDVLTKIGIIQEGGCSVHVNVPQLTGAKVKVGELKTGDCIGEVLLRGNSVQPYKVVTTSPKTRIGWISLTAIKVSEFGKHMLSDRKFSLPNLSKEVIRDLYADTTLIHQQTQRRRDIVEEVVRERGIEFGRSKWRHTQHYNIKHKTDD